MSDVMETGSVRVCVRVCVWSEVNCWIQRKHFDMRFDGRCRFNQSDSNRELVNSTIWYLLICRKRNVLQHIERTCDVFSLCFVSFLSLPFFATLLTPMQTIRRWMVEHTFSQFWNSSQCSANDVRENKIVLGIKIFASVVHNKIGKYICKRWTSKRKTEKNRWRQSLVPYVGIGSVRPNESRVSNQKNKQWIYYFYRDFQVVVQDFQISTHPVSSRLST